MPRYPASIERLISEFKRLPGVGEKTAERYVFSLLRRGREAAGIMAEALLALERGIRLCGTCRAASETDPCSICRDPARNDSQLCIVADHQSQAALERTGDYKGRYFILGGLLSPMDGITPETLGIEALDVRIRKAPLDELVLAINPSIEGEATIGWLSRRYAGIVPRVSRLARGLPRGADLEFADEVTLSDAYTGRKEIVKQP